MRLRPTKGIGKKGKILFVLLLIIVVVIVVAIFQSQSPKAPKPDGGLTKAVITKDPNRLVTLPGVETFPNIFPDNAANSASEIEVPQDLLEVAPYLQPDDRGGEDINDLFVSKYLADASEIDVTNWYIDKIFSAGYDIASPYGEAAILNVTSPDGKKYAIDIEQQGTQVAVLVATKGE